MIICYKISTTALLILGVAFVANVFLDLRIGSTIDKCFDLWMLGLVAILAIDAIRALWTFF